jgi:glycosyltransferase involved in cell wall biosynthesis
VICSSHLFHDTFPLLFLSGNPIKITYIHHIIGQQKRTNFLNFITVFLEKISFLILKIKKVRIFTVSRAVAVQLVTKYDFCNDKISISSNGINLEAIDEVSGVFIPKYDLVFCGRLNFSKGILDLISIIKKIRVTQPNILCAVVGTGAEADFLKQKIIENDLTHNIELLGFLEERKKIEIFKSSKLFILPSHEEGWGIVIAEAMACNLPVVLYKLPDIIDIWQDKVVWVECFNEAQFASKIIETLNNQENLCSLARQALAYARDLSWDNVFQNEFKVLDRLCG